MYINEVPRPREVRLATAKDVSKKKLLTTREAAEEIGISKRTLEKWRIQRKPDGSRKGPPWVDVDGQIRYPRAGIAEYLDARTSPDADDFVA